MNEGQHGGEDAVEGRWRQIICNSAPYRQHLEDKVADRTLLTHGSLHEVR